MTVSRLPVHPGKVIKRELEAINISPNKLAVELRVPASRIDRIVKCQRSVTPVTALRLAQFFGGSAKFWLKLQSNHDLAIAETEEGQKVREEITPFVLEYEMATC